MPWIKVDDHYDEHPKFSQVGPLGAALWLAGMAYCNRNLTDGYIPWTVGRTLVSWDFLDATGPTRIYIGTPTYVHEENHVTSDYVIELLLAAGLWTEDTERGGYRVHDYHSYQPSRAEVMEERRKAAERQSRARSQRDSRRDDARSHGVSPLAPVPVPVPRSSSGVLPLRGTGQARALGVEST